ncbi:hypothetical protein MBANPS3_006495 [Mucor bainieri]
MPIQSLPTELLFKVFGNLHNLESLCQCKLVCKSWNSIAEKEMFRRVIQLQSLTKINSFASFLSQKPDIARSIKYLTLTSYSYYNDQPLERICVDLLRLVFTPNMVELRGKFQGPVFEEMMRIKNNSVWQFDQLAVMPDPTTQGANLQSYYAAALAFQESLKELVINPSFLSAPYYKHLVDRLDGFKSLTWLIIDRQPINPADLHHILSKCYSLTTLSFNFTPDSDSYFPWNATETLEWIKSIAIKNRPPLKHVDLHSEDPCPDLVEYLMAKYTEIQDIKGQTMLEHMHTLDDSHSLFPVKKAPTCNMEFIFFSDLSNQSIESKLQAGSTHAITVEERMGNGWRQVVLQDRHTIAKQEPTGIYITNHTKRFFGL